MNAVIEDRPTDYVAADEPAAAPSTKCTRCEGRKSIWSESHRKLIRCPACTGMGSAAAERLVSELTAVERRRIEQASRTIRAAVRLALMEHRNPCLIVEPTKRAVDRVMQRWAVGHGSGLPPEDPGALKCRPPRLDEDLQLLIDDVVNRAPDLIRHFIGEWYRTETPPDVMARRWGMSVASLYRRWDLILEWLDLMFRGAKHAGLLRLLVIERD
ncbi:MAG: hypothetical protein ACREUG_08350 [Steroidobacteraceae bacterium]